MEGGGGGGGGGRYKAGAYTRPTYPPNPKLPNFKIKVAYFCAPSNLRVCYGLVLTASDMKIPAAQNIMGVPQLTGFAYRAGNLRWPISATQQTLFQTQHGII